MEKRDGRSVIGNAVKILEDHGFRVTDAREERAVPAGNGHVIDDRGLKPTGAILLRVVAYEGADRPETEF